MDPRTRPKARRSRRAFTLVELVVAASLAAIVLLGLQSAVLIASKAIPPATQPDDRAAEARALDRLSLDLSYAITITAATARSITFTVADRTGDAAPDSVTYSWSGVAGEPLQRTLNGSSPETILANVSSLSFALTSSVITGGASYVESGEVLLASYASSSDLADATIDTLGWAGQLIPVTLPNGAVDFRTTRVRMTVDGAGSADGTSRIELRSVRNQTPTARVLASATFAETSSQSVIARTLTSSRYLDANERIALIVRPISDPPSCDLVCRKTGASAAAGLMYTTSNGGASWTGTSGASLLYDLWGVYRTIGDTESRRAASFVRVILSTRSSAKLELNLPLPNMPTVTP